MVLSALTVCSVLSQGSVETPTGMDLKMDSVKSDVEF